MYSYQNNDKQNFRINDNVLDASWLQDSNRITSGLAGMRAEVRLKTKPIGVSWYLFVPLLAMTCVFLMPQMREYFFKRRMALGSYIFIIVWNLIQSESNIFQNCI